jgi:hypothetical protein
VTSQHEEPERTVDAEAEAAAEDWENGMLVVHPDQAAAQDGEGEQGGEAVEYTVERIIKKRTSGGVAQYWVKWVGWNDADNTWEPKGNFDPQMLQNFADWEARRKQAAAQAAKKKKPTKEEASRPPPPPPMQRVKCQQLVPEGMDWDLQEEPCFMCRHPCFFSMVVSSHKDAYVQPSGGVAGEGDEDGADAVAVAMATEVRSTHTSPACPTTPALFPDLNRDKAASDRYLRYRSDGQLTEQR